MILLIKSTFYNETKTKEKLIKFIKKSPILSFSKECEKFEHNLARYQERKYCVFVNSGSSANLALVQALLNLGKIQKGDKVGFSALTWSTNVMPLIQLGLVPIPIDVDLKTLNVSSETLKNAIKSNKIKALFLTNLLGFCSDIDVIANLCKANKIVLIEDNCESLGTVYKGKKLGNYGFASTNSFYVGHHMSTIEGGAICTDNLSLANELRMVRAHGWDRNLSLNRQKKMRDKFKVNSTFYSRYTFYDLGYNLRPTEINGFIGNIQIDFLDEILKKRNSNFLRIVKEINKNKKYYPISYEHIDFVSNFAIPIICKTISVRNQLVEKCDGLIEIRPIVGGDMTQQPFFEKYIKNYRYDNKAANLIHQNGLYLGNNPELTNKEIELILETIA